MARAPAVGTYGNVRGSEIHERRNVSRFHDQLAHSIDNPASQVSFVVGGVLQLLVRDWRGDQVTLDADA